MPFKKLTKSKFLKTADFKVFLTVWIVYVFYLQMFGFSHMATNQSALTAAIVNEGRFKIDTYYRAGGEGVAYYKGHYYSGQAPGISFLSVPLYLISKPFFYLLPESTINTIFEKLEKYGEKLPEDWQGKKRILSNYFPDLTKRQILEYVLISGFILPVFTTALISSLSVVCLYSILKYFSRDEKLRILITLFYGFGTLIFPLSTEFFERPIAIAFMFAAFVILFKIRHKELKPTKKVLFISGALAGLSGGFDYFHIFLSAILFFYFLAFLLLEEKNLKLTKTKFLMILSFGVGITVPIILLGLYHYTIFDNPFTISYTYMRFPEDRLTLSGLRHLSMPNSKVLFNMAVFFLYSPIIILAFYGLFRALLKKDRYFVDAAAVLAIIIATFLFSTLLVLAYYTLPSATVGSSFKRYMKPILPYTMIFLSYVFDKHKIVKKKVSVLFFVFGGISIFLNWLSAQYGGHGALGHFDLKTMKFVFIERFLKIGPSSQFLDAFAGVFHLNSLLLNLVGLAALIVLIYFIWKPYFAKIRQLL